jgi:hypothetical protein
VEAHKPSTRENPVSQPEQIAISQGSLNKLFRKHALQPLGQTTFSKRDGSSGLKHMKDPAGAVGLTIQSKVLSLWYPV